MTDPTSDLSDLGFDDVVAQLREVVSPVESTAHSRATPRDAAACPCPPVDTTSCCAAEP